MNNQEIKKAAKGNTSLTQQIASHHNDPDFYSVLNFLPNPDVVLRKLGKSEEVFEAIALDSHVMGELRSTRAGLLGFEWRLRAGGDAPADLRALELCQAYMSQRPAPGMSWGDVFWNMFSAVLRGQRIHEVVWAKQGDVLMPTRLLDKPGRLFRYGPDRELLLRTRAKPMSGEVVDDYKWLVSRHMPTYDNPYGVAVFSSCFWPYTFKHSGFKFFMKFCEKYGVPWAIGKIPRGSSQDDFKALAQNLADMVEDGVAAIPDDGSVELLSLSQGGESIQERLIQSCNREMSKALTSQTLATEINGQGSRAAAQTHSDRADDVTEADREIVCDTMNELMGWITALNVAGAVSPVFEFYEEEDVNADRVDALDKARQMMDVPAAFAYRWLQIPEPVDGEPVLSRDGPMPGPPAQFNAHSCPHCAHEFAGADGGDAIDKLTDQAATEADKIIADMAAPIRALLDGVETLEQFRDGLLEMYPKIDDQRLGELTQQALMVGGLMGVDDAG